MQIICAVDGSENSRWGVQTLEALAEWGPEHVTLLHVIDTQSLQTSKSKTQSVDKRALKAMEKAGQLVLREAERSARVALGQAATRRPAPPSIGCWSVVPSHRPLSGRPIAGRRISSLWVPED